MTSNRQAIKEYINEQIAQIDFRAKAYVFDNENRKKPHRNIFATIQSYLNKFLAGNLSYRWITLTGLRGAGKTTILYQLYHNNKNIEGYFLAISMDEVTQTLNSSINEIITNFEEIIGKPITNLDKPLFLLIDEVQYDKNWGIALKTIFDKSNKVFIFTTGSSAILMNMNADIARRAIPEKIFPLSFSEFIKIKNNHFEINGLSDEIRETIFHQTNAQSVYSTLKEKESRIQKYLLKISKFDFEDYLYYGTLPFMLDFNNDSLVFNQISKTLEKVVYIDIPQAGSLTTEIINKIPGLLYAIADMDAFNFSTLSDRFEISRPKIAEIFSILEKTEVLHRIYPYGSHFNQVTKKPYKYLFSSPAFRAMYYKMIGNTISKENSKGKLIEDLVGMYLYQLVGKIDGFSLTYDSAQGGADFILSLTNRKIIIEVGAGKKDFKQIIKTSGKISANYSLIISSSELELNKELNTVKIPLKYFVLI